jgi:hypothetical protein
MTKRKEGGGKDSRPFSELGCLATSAFGPVSAFTRESESVSQSTSGSVLKPESCCAQQTGMHKTVVEALLIAIYST